MEERRVVLEGKTYEKLTNDWSLGKETEKAYLIINDEYGYDAVDYAYWFPKSICFIRGADFYYQHWKEINWKKQVIPDQDDESIEGTDCTFCGEFFRSNTPRVYCSINCCDSDYLEQMEMDEMNTVSKMKSSFGGMGDKMMNRFFKRADNVVWDLMTGRIGVSTEEGIITLEGTGEDATVELNLMDAFGMAVPAFAQSTPTDKVDVGDLIYNNGKIKGWVTTVNTKKGENDDEVFRSFTLITPSGTSSTWRPPKVAMLGFDSGVMVLRSLINMLPGGDTGLNSMQGMLMPMLMMGGGDMDMDSIMPMMLFSQLGASGEGGDSGNMMGGNMMQTMMLMQMMKGGKSGGGNGGFFD